MAQIFFHTGKKSRNHNFVLYIIITNVFYVLFLRHKRVDLVLIQPSPLAAAPCFYYAALPLHWAVKGYNKLKKSWNPQEPAGSGSDDADQTAGDNWSTCTIRPRTRHTTNQ